MVSKNREELLKKDKEYRIKNKDKIKERRNKINDRQVENEI